MISLKYLYAKFFKLVLRGKCVINSNCDKSAVIMSGANFVNSSLGQCSYVGYDSEIINPDIGKFCSIANYVFIGGAEHPMQWVSTSPVFQNAKHSGPTKRFAKHNLPASKRTIIENDVWIAHGAIIKAGVKIGNGAVVGAGAIVTKDVPPYAIVAGNPAKIIKYRFDEKTIQGLLNSQWWILSEEKLKSVASFVKEPEKFIEALRRNEI